MNADLNTDANTDANTDENADLTWTADEMMNIAAARELHDGDVCLVGVGPPNLAANLARRTHAPGVRLVYESGAIDARPRRLPLSIGDDDLAETATAVVSVPEMFNYWVGAGRIDVGFLGAAQLDRYANINTTVIGDHTAPKVRLPGAGGAPEIAAAARRVIVIVRQSPRTFVERVDFVSSVGYGSTGTERADLGLPGTGPTLVITDLGVLEPDPVTHELTLTRLHPGVTADQARAATGWPLRVSQTPSTVTPPTDEELTALRALARRDPAGPARPIDATAALNDSDRGDGGGHDRDRADPDDRADRDEPSGSAGSTGGVAAGFGATFRQPVTKSCTQAQPEASDG